MALAIRTGGKLVGVHERALTALVAQVLLRGPDGTVTNIDIIDQLYDTGGLAKANQFTERALGRALLIETAPGHMIKVLHPLDVLASRVQNAAGRPLMEKGPHVLTQAIWGMDVARAAILRSAAARGPATLAEQDRPGAAAQEVLRLALSAAGRVLHNDHGVEVAEAVPFDELSRLQPGFARQAHHMREQLLRARSQHADAGEFRNRPYERA